MEIKDIQKQFPDWTITEVDVPIIGGTRKMFQAERSSGVYIKFESIETLVDFLSGKYHTPECFAKISELWQEQDDWTSINPDYCRHCQGEGGFWGSYDPSPAGVSLGSGSIDDWENCPECLDLGNCPRCGHYIGDPETLWIETDFAVCPHCGWNENVSGGVGLPKGSEYFCECQTEE